MSTGSSRLSALEDTFGTRLFKRDHTGLRLTASGERFVQHARTMLSCLEQMMAEALASSREQNSDEAAGLEQCAAAHAPALGTGVS